MGLKYFFNSPCHRIDSSCNNWRECFCHWISASMVGMSWQASVEMGHGPVASRNHAAMLPWHKATLARMPAMPKNFPNERRTTSEGWFMTGVILHSGERSAKDSSIITNPWGVCSIHCRNAIRSYMRPVGLFGLHRMTTSVCAGISSSVAISLTSCPSARHTRACSP